MTIFKRILVPTDFGDASKRALELALSIAERFDSQVTLFHAYSIPAAALGYAETIPWPLGDLASAAQQALDVAVATAIKRYASVCGVVVYGDPPDQILEAAKREHSDLIVMGTHGRRGLSRVLLGSVAERIVRLSPVPVLTASMNPTSNPSPAA